ncbi:MAG: TIGR00730 family Rossman fold protein [Bacteroidota bacterium]
MQSIAVFCGSSPGLNSIYTEATRQLGEVMGEQGITLVYGAGNVGLMGVVADAVLSKNGKVVGTIPQFLVDKEVAHYGISELIITETMHERKQKMVDVSEGVIVLPGGIGTLDEFFEMFTWQQLGLHNQPIGILNVNGFYDHLIAHIRHMVQEGFLKDFHGQRMLIDENPTALIQKMKAQKIQYVDKWWEK